MASLLPLPDHLGHTLHSLPPVFQTALERTLPELTLDLLPDTSTLDPETVLNALLLLDFGVLGRAWHQWENIVGDGELEELGLAAERVVRRVPVSSARVFEGEEWIAVARVAFFGSRFRSGGGCGCVRVGGRCG